MNDEKRKDTRGCWKIVGTSGDSSCPDLTAKGHCRNCSEYTSAGRGLFDREIPADYLLEWTELVTREKERETTDLVSAIVFRLGSEWLALGTRYFQEITEERVVHSVPHRTNRVFRGLVNVGGELLLCVSAADILGVGAESGTRTEGKAFRRMAVVRQGGRRIVFQVDEVLGVYRFAPKELQMVPATISKSAVAFTRGIFDLGDKRIGLLDEQMFFNSVSFDF